jgi:hypothetical protein
VTKCQIRVSPLFVRISRSPLSTLASRSKSDAITDRIAAARSPYASRVHSGIVASSSAL